MRKDRFSHSYQQIDASLSHLKYVVSGKAESLRLVLKSSKANTLYGNARRTTYHISGSPLVKISQAKM
jgi:hypothetical protein